METVERVVSQSTKKRGAIGYLQVKSTASK